MIKPMMVDLKVDATLGDGFYYCFYSRKELGFIKSYLHFFFFFFEKSYKLVWDLRTLVHFQVSEISPDGIRA